MNKIALASALVVFSLGGCLGPGEGKAASQPSLSAARSIPFSGSTQAADGLAPQAQPAAGALDATLEFAEPAPASALELFCGGVAGLKGSLQSLVSSAPSGEWAVYLQDLPHGTVVSINADQPMHPASTIKVAIAIAFLRWFESHPAVPWTSGPVPHERSFEQLLRAMVVISEEDATASLTNFLMDQQRIDLNREVQSWGAAQTTVVPRRSTARDLGLILERLANGDLLSEAGTDYLLDLMRTPTPSKLTRLGAGLPAGPQDLLAHKTGTTFQQGLGVVADSGLVQWEGTSYVIVVLSNHVQWVDYSSAMALIAQISRVAYACLGPEAAWPSSVRRGGPSP